MIDRKQLLSDLQKQVKLLEDDLRQRCDEEPSLDAPLKAEYDEALEAGRTGSDYGSWRDEQLTGTAVSWILACVFVRFLEDNHLVDEPMLAGPGEALKHARDRHQVFLRERPSDTDREYLESIFAEVGALPVAEELFAADNALTRMGPSGDFARQLVLFWQRQDPDTGDLAHDFTDPELDTRFLGDLYQDLSEAAQKRYALKQTPEFVEEFILDRTLDPALAEHGLEGFRLIDPACGSGHFLLGAFARLLARWQEAEPGTKATVLAQRALDSVYGVDVNPFAVVVARFRLLLAALKACGEMKLAGATNFHTNVIVADTLLHAPQLAEIRGKTALLPNQENPLAHVTALEDPVAIARVFGQRYHAVVANPPYITVKDKALNQAYRGKWGACYRLYAMSVPFLQVCFELATTDKDGMAGYMGQITANSFMKREFGKKLIETFIPKWDVTHLIDTSGAYIPGHGTPTVILFGQHRPPVGESVRAVLGIRGEPSTPVDPAQGLVWQSILQQVDEVGSEGDYVSCVEMERSRLHAHPWSIGGGGAVELRESLEVSATKLLGMVADSIGFVCITKQDEVFAQPVGVLERHRVAPEHLRRFGIGENVRDWGVDFPEKVIFPYTDEVVTRSECELDSVLHFAWPWRTDLWARKVFGGKTYRDVGKPWYEYGQIPVDRFRTPLSIAFAFVATHNHFVLDRGGKVFKQSAPVIKLPPDATEDDQLELLGLLNSSTACFWLKQVCMDKGVGGIGGGIGDEAWEPRYEFDGTKLKSFPLAAAPPVTLVQDIGDAARQATEALDRYMDQQSRSASALAAASSARQETLRLAVTLQEELDWHCYQLYGLTDEALVCEEPPPVELGQRAFEIVMARRMAPGHLQTEWFKRHRSTPTTEIPAHWPESYRELVQKRIDLIESDRNIGLIEQPEYKRRWATEPWEKQVERALRTWLLDRLEAPELWPEPRLRTCRELADLIATDAKVMEVAELYRGHSGFDLTELVTELVLSEAVPVLPACRYKPPGLRKRAAWEQTWALQRREDAGEDVGTIPVPPKYKSSDFKSSVFWRLRGKLDVPKERFLLHDFAERGGDPTPVVGWAGWDHLQQAEAAATWALERKDAEGWQGEQLIPLLLAVRELVPWLKQWHNELDPRFGMRMGDYYADTFLAGELAAQGLSHADLDAWVPPKRTRKRAGSKKKRAPKKKKAAAKTEEASS